jgi:hypothetical protein
LSVTTHEELADRRAKVVAAGHATASWVRARRANWAAEPPSLPHTARQTTLEPTPVVAVTPPPPPAEPSVPLADRLAAASTAASTALKAPLDRARAVAESPVWSRVAEAPGSAARALRDPIARWTPRLLVALAVVGLGFVAVRYAPAMLKSLAERAPAALTPSTTTTAPATTTRRTALKIESTPPGARILVDGTDRGNTPLELDDVPPGKHVVTLESSVGTVQRTVTVTAGLTTEVNESIFAGFVTVYSPFEVSITEGSRAFRPDDRNEIMLPAGRHELKLSNRALGFEEVRTVELTPGQRLTLSVTPPQSSISVTATEPSEVWLDNFKLGDTPLPDTPATLGTHELVVRRAAGGERRLTITVTAKPFSIFVDFSKGP